MWAGENERARWLFTSRFHPEGKSDDPYDNFNLALHVGDRPTAVNENRAIVASFIGVDSQLLIWPELVHSTMAIEISTVGDPISPADILYTSNPSLALATMSADCVPLVAISKENQFILTAHIGWQGAAKDISSNIAQILISKAQGNADIILGPAICGNCYQVDTQRFEQVLSVLPASAVGDHGLDLRHGLHMQFESLGFDVQTTGPCTFESQSLFSYRRQQLTGRQSAVVKLR